MIEADESQLHSRGIAAFPNPAGAQDEAASLLDILIILAGRKRLITKVTVGSALIAAFASLVLPVRYTATATLLPPPRISSMGASLSSDLSGMSSQANGLGGIATLASTTLGLANPNDRYVGMLKSHIVEDTVIQRLGLMKEYHKKYLSEARKKLEDRTEVNGDGKDSLIHISVEDPSPQRALEIVNGYVDQFRNLSQELAIGEASERRLFFEQQLLQAKNNLADAEEALKRTEQTTGLIQLDSQDQALIETAATLRAQIAVRETMIQGMQAYATDQNAQLVQANRELDSLRTQLAQLSGSQKSADGLIVPRGLVPEADLEYVRKLRDVKYYETIFEILARQYELAKLDEAKAGAIIQLVDPAIQPDKKSFPKRSLIVIVGTAVGFFMGVFMALARAELERMGGNLETRTKIAFLQKMLHLGSSGAASVNPAKRSL